MLTRIKNCSQGRKNEKGAILFLVAGAMVVMLGMAGLAFDLGMLYNVKTDLQNAVDAAALAGAWKLNGTSQGITDAVASAQAAANSFQFQDHPINLASGDITFSTQRNSGFVPAGSVSSAASIRFVRAGKSATTGLYMIKAIPGVGNTRTVAAFAVAGQSPPLNTICDGVVPLAPVPQGGGTIENYTPGNYYTYRLVPGNDVGTDVGTARAVLLDFPPGPLLLSSATKGCIEIGDQRNIYTNWNPDIDIVTPLNQRFDEDTNRFEYMGGTSVTWQYNRYVQDSPKGNGRRVFVVPFISAAQGSWAPITGPGSIYILNYGCFFLRERVPVTDPEHPEIKGEFIGKCDVQGYFDPNAPAPPSVGLPSITKIVLYR